MNGKYLMLLGVLFLSMNVSADRNYIHDFTIYYGDSDVVWSPDVVCTNLQYTVKIGIASGIREASEDSIQLQSSSGGIFSPLPNADFSMWGEDTNPKAVSFSGSGEAPTYGLTYADFKMVPLKAGTYTLRDFMSNYNNAIYPTGSNQLPIKVRDCEGIDIGFRDIKLVTSSGKHDVFDQGDIIYANILLSNFANETQNVTVTNAIYLNGEQIPAYFQTINEITEIMPSIPNLASHANYVAIFGGNGFLPSQNYEFAITVNGKTYRKQFAIAPKKIDLALSGSDYLGYNSEESTERYKLDISFCANGEYYPLSKLTLAYPPILQYENSDGNATSNGTAIIWNKINLKPYGCFTKTLSFKPIAISGLNSNFYATFEGNGKTVTAEKIIAQPSSADDTSYPYIEIYHDDHSLIPFVGGYIWPTNIFIKPKWYGGSSNSNSNINLHFLELNLPPMSGPLIMKGAEYMPGFPVGSVNEGWKIKFRSLGFLEENGAKEIILHSSTGNGTVVHKNMLFEGKSIGTIQQETQTSIPFRYKQEKIRKYSPATSILFPTICGDVNYDFQINRADVDFLTEYIFKKGPEPVNFASGDVNLDKKINNGDVVYLVNYLYSNGPRPCAGNGFANSESMLVGDPIRKE